MHRGKRDRKDTARLALVSLAGTASATRATLLRCCHLQQRQENRAHPSLVFSPQLQPSARLAPKQQGARCSRGDEGRGQAFIPAEDRGIGNKARVAGAARRPGGVPQSPAFQPSGREDCTLECTRFTDGPKRHQTYPPQSQSHRKFKVVQMEKAAGGSRERLSFSYSKLDERGW